MVHKVQVNMTGFREERQDRGNFEEDPVRCSTLERPIEFEWRCLGTTKSEISCDSLRIRQNRESSFMLEPEEHHRIEVDGND